MIPLYPHLDFLALILALIRILILIRLDPHSNPDPDPFPEQGEGEGDIKVWDEFYSQLCEDIKVSPKILLLCYICETDDHYMEIQI